MVDEDSREAGGEEKSGGAGYEDLSMNVVPAAVTEEQSESGRRAGGLVLLVVGVLVVVVVAVLGGRFLLNPHPGQEAEDRLRQRLSELPAWRLGVVLEAGYKAGDRVWLGFAPSIRTARVMEEGGESKVVVVEDEAREKIRGATREAMRIVIEQRPGRDLYIDGYSGDDIIVEAYYRHKSTAIVPGREGMLDIVVRVAGDPKEGMGQAYGRTGRSRGSE